MSSRIALERALGRSLARERSYVARCASTRSNDARFDERTQRAEKKSEMTSSSTARAPYVAALGDTVRKVKLLSLASLGACVVGTPALIELTSPSLVFEAKAAACGTVLSFGTFTTVLLQWFVSPYVKTMRIEKGGEIGAETRVRATKFGWNARTYETTFAASAMRESESSRPLVSWEADGRLFYVEMGGVPKYMYDELDLVRFDDQAKAEAAAEKMTEEELDD